MNILSSLILSILISCITLFCNGNKPLVKCNSTCDQEVLIDKIENLIGTVYIHSNDYKRSDTVFTIFVEGYDILVPCNLPEEYKIDKLKVRLDGDIKSCCKLLTRPNSRTQFGCKFEITAICRLI